MIYVKDNVERLVDNAAEAQKLESLGFKKKEAKKPVRPVEPEIVKQEEPVKATPKRRRRSTKN